MADIEVAQSEIFAYADQYVNERAVLDPIFGTDIGMHEVDHLLPDFSSGQEHRNLAHTQTALEHVTGLQPGDERDRRAQREEQRPQQKEHRDPLSAVQTAPQRQEGPGERGDQGTTESPEHQHEVEQSEGSHDRLEDHGDGVPECGAWSGHSQDAPTLAALVRPDGEPRQLGSGSLCALHCAPLESIRTHYLVSPVREGPCSFEQCPLYDGWKLEWRRFGCSSVASGRRHGSRADALQ